MRCRRGVRRSLISRSRVGCPSPTAFVVKPRRGHCDQWSETGRGWAQRHEHAVINSRTRSRSSLEWSGSASVAPSGS